MSLKKYIIQSLEASIPKIINEVEDLTGSCPNHDLDSRPSADAYPYQGKLYWKLDRLNESIYRLGVLKHSVRR